MKRQSKTRPYRSLVEYRRANNLSQTEAAHKLGVSQSYWSKVELGMRCPRPALAARLMRETGVPLEVLMGIAS